MKKLLIISLLLFSAQCGQNDQRLSISVVPDHPVLIPTGEVQVNGTSLAAPFFGLTQITLTWKGPGSVQILAIQFKSTSTVDASTYFCTIAGDDLLLLFPSNLSTSGVVVNEPASGQTTTQAISGAFYCGGVPIANKDADFFSIPFKVKVYGAVVDPNNPTNASGRANATTVITVQ